MIDLKSFRKENNLSQKEVSELLEVKQSYVSAIEGGKRPLSEDKFKILYNHFGDIILKYKRPDVIIEVRQKRDDESQSPPKKGFSNVSPDLIAYMREKDARIEEKEKEIRELIRANATLEAKLEMAKRGEGQ